MEYNIYVCVKQKTITITSSTKKENEVLSIAIAYVDLFN